jgi:4-hydroxy-tetrahydrodipicolinate synthase
MASSLSLSGVYVPLITPFAADGSIAVGDLRSLASGYLDSGAAGLVALGTTGEPATLSVEEQDLVVSVVSEICIERSALLMVGVGSNNTASCAEAIRKVADVPGVGAILSVVPYYTRPSEDGILEHYSVLAQASSVPLVAYNIPYRTGRGLGSRALVELSAMDNMAGLKQAVGGVDTDTLELMSAKAPGFHVLCGDDQFIYPLMCLGGAGAIAASSHVATELFVELVQAGAAGDFDRSRVLAEKLLPVCKALFAEPSPAVIKSVLLRQGRIGYDGLRLPMTSASKAAADAAISAIESIY